MFTDPELSRVILFTRTKHRANRVAEQLEKMGVPAEAIHGNKSQAARQKALKRFRAGNCRVLVATDIAARGIDIDGVTHVINFELPNEPKVTFTGSGGQPERVPAVSPSRSAIRRNANISAISKSF